MLQLVVFVHKHFCFPNMRLVLALLALLRVSFKITVLLLSHCFKVLFLQTIRHFEHTHKNTHTAPNKTLTDGSLNACHSCHTIVSEHYQAQERVSVFL